MMEDIGKRKLKISILGANKSGKTALTVRFLTGKFIFEYASGHDIIYQHNFVVSSTQVPIQIVDTSCNENPTEAINGSDGMVVVYAIDNKNSFQKAKEILSELTESDVKEPCVALVANKSDLWPHKSVERDDGKRLADRYQCKYYEMSALSCKDGVYDMFNSVINLAVEKVKVRSLSLPTFSKAIIMHDEIKRSQSCQFPKKESKSNGHHKTKTMTKSFSMSSNISSEGKQHTNNHKSRSRTASETSNGKCDVVGSTKLDGHHNHQNGSNISRLLQKTLMGDLNHNISSEQKKSDKSSLIHKTLGDMGHIAFSAIAFPMSMNPRELKA